MTSGETPVSPWVVALICFAVVFGSGLLGLLVRSRLPEPHLIENSMGVVKLGAGLLATLSALVLSLLIASAKDAFDHVDDEFNQAAVNVIMLDRLLAEYGPETQEARQQLKIAFEAAVEKSFSGRDGSLAAVDRPQMLAHWERLSAKIRALKPGDDGQRYAQSEALARYKDVVQARWLLIEKQRHGMPAPFLLVLVLWLALIFAGFGLVTVSNTTVVTVLFLCALSVSGSVFLIEEMYHPLDGVMRISRAPMDNALSHLGE
jgi:hypothetical protein